jgi:hypothetical protein
MLRRTIAINRTNPTQRVDGRFRPAPDPRFRGALGSYDHEIWRFPRALFAPHLPAAQH